MSPMARKSLEKLSSKHWVNAKSGNCSLHPGKEMTHCITSTSVYCVTGCFPKFSMARREEAGNWNGRNVCGLVNRAHSQFDCVFLTLVIREVQDPG